MQHPALTLARFVPAEQNRSALLAVRRVIACVCSRRARLPFNPLFLHGPPGAGKTHLVGALLAGVTRRCPDLVVTALSAGDLALAAQKGADENGDAENPLSQARASDLLVIEDLQHLPVRVAGPLAGVLDSMQARQQPVVLTATTGPQQLSHRGERFPTRLTSRLAGGLVVGLQPLDAAGRLALLEARVQERKLLVGRDVLAWLAERLSGGRQLDGALQRLEGLARLHKGPLDVATIAPHFREQAEASSISVERIAQRVGGYFQVELRQLQSSRRSRGILVPRQVGMYLARQLTGLSLEQIGAYFGGRDHSTVLHACRKVEEALSRDAALCGAVRQLHAELM
ncbi:MAG: DnaA/Hda family protein [Gemmataceae bacterium]|nr:DnaA/Hda family protein [Gemmataceae bacterium]